jgi:pimeloyl-ACP methyl ester carboxylesterase
VLDRLLTIPLQQIEALLSESWFALRGSSRYADVPPLRPSAGLIAEALLDRTFTLGTSVLTGVPGPEVVRKMLEDLGAARKIYAAQGWLDDPVGYHQEPTPYRGAEESEAVAWDGPRRRRYRALRAPSDYAPHPGEPGAERWLAHPTNGTAHAHLVEGDPDAGWLVCVHGFGMGSPTVGFPAFGARALHDSLGLNLAFPVLPLHGARGAGRMSGSEVLTPDYVQMVHLFANAAWDVRRLVRWLRRERGARRIGLYGISLGAYVAALVASLEDGLECVIAGIPAVDFAGLARDNEPWVMRRYVEEFDIDWQLVRAVTQPVSPLAMAPRLPRERRFIYAGIADRVVRPDQPRALWRHWEQPQIHWFSGGHVLGIREPSVARFLEGALRGSGLLR